LLNLTVKNLLEAEICNINF